MCITSRGWSVTIIIIISKQMVSCTSTMAMGLKKGILQELTSTLRHGQWYRGQGAGTIKQKLKMLPSQGICMQSLRSSCVDSQDFRSLSLESPCSKYLPSLPPPSHRPDTQVLMRQTVPRTSRLDPSNLTSTSPSITFEKVKFIAFYCYPLFNGFVLLDRQNDTQSKGGKS